MTAKDGCKVDRIQTDYDLTNLDERILRRRQNENASLRDLEDYVNLRVLRAAMEDAGVQTRGRKDEHYHDRLHTGGIASDEARRELEENGVDVESVMTDFVSYQTVRKHLNECLNVPTSEDYEPDIHEELQRVGRLETRVENVVSKTIDKLQKYDELDIREPQITVSIKVRCRQCNSTQTIRQLLRKGRCQCPVTPEEEAPFKT